MVCRTLSRPRASAPFFLSLSLSLSLVACAELTYGPRDGGAESGACGATGERCCTDGNACNDGLGCQGGRCGPCRAACRGACCVPDHATVVCNGNACGLSTCEASYGDCNGDAGDGCETDLTRDPAHCGRCDRVCALPRGTLTNTCASGACAPTCATGFGDCDGITANGCEQSLNSVDHCAACTTVCGASEACLPPPPPNMSEPFRCVRCGDQGMACCQQEPRCNGALQCGGMTCER